MIGSDGRWGYDAAAMSGMGLGRGTSMSARAALRAYWAGQDAMSNAANYSEVSVAARLVTGGSSIRRLAPRGNPAYELAPQLSSLTRPWAASDTGHGAYDGRDGACHIYKSCDHPVANTRLQRARLIYRMPPFSDCGANRYLIPSTEICASCAA
jgi:hypothetical protein